MNWFCFGSYVNCINFGINLSLGDIWFYGGNENSIVCRCCIEREGDFFGECCGRFGLWISDFFCEIWLLNCFCWEIVVYLDGCVWYWSFWFWCWGMYSIYCFFIVIIFFDVFFDVVFDFFLIFVSLVWVFEWEFEVFEFYGFDVVYIF